MVAASAVFLAAFAAPLYRFWTELSEHRAASGVRSVGELLREGEAIPWWVYLCLLTSVAVPIALGTLVGRAVRSRKPRWRAIGRLIGGKDPAPRAWDFVFSSSPGATVRLRLKEGGTWIGGQFGEGSYAAGYPEEPQDLYLEATYAMSQDDGSFLEDADGDFVELGSGLLIRWGEVHFLEVFPLEEQT